MTGSHNQSQPMTADELLAELRRHETEYPELVHGPLCGEAANEIERLRAKVDEMTAALREISDLYVNAPGWAAPAPSHQREYKMHKIAHTALAVNSQHSDGEAGR